MQKTKQNVMNEKEKDLQRIREKCNKTLYHPGYPGRGWGWKVHGY